jgi:hypothetical protein
MFETTIKIKHKIDTSADWWADVLDGDAREDADIKSIGVTTEKVKK